MKVVDDLIFGHAVIAVFKTSRTDDRNYAGDRTSITGLSCNYHQAWKNDELKNKS